MTKNNASIITHVFRDYVAAPRWVGWHIVDDSKVPLVGTSKAQGEDRQARDVATVCPMFRRPARHRVQRRRPRGR